MKGSKLVGFGCLQIKRRGDNSLEKLNNDKTAIKEGLQKCKVHKNQKKVWK